MTAPPPDRIVVVDADELHYARSTNPGAFDNPSTLIITPPRAGEAVDNPHVREALPLLRPGVILLRNPLGAGPRYVAEAQAYEELNVAKFMAFTLVCQKLGATSVVITDFRVTHEGRTLNGSLGGSAASLATVGTTVDDARVERIIQRTKVEAKFKPESRWSLGRGAEKARQAARSLGIEHDHATTTLIQMREDASNRLTEFSLQLDISAEASRTIDWTLNLEMILRKISPNIAAAFNRLRAGNDRMVLDVNVTF
jgi:hypothetical protein